MGLERSALNFTSGQWGPAGDPSAKGMTHGGVPGSSF